MTDYLYVPFPIKFIIMLHFIEPEGHRTRFEKALLRILANRCFALPDAIYIYLLFLVACVLLTFFHLLFLQSSVDVVAFSLFLQRQ